VIWNAAVLQHYLDGIQFALGDLPADATPRSGRPLDELLVDVAKYEYGNSRQPLAEVDDFIRSASGSSKKLKAMEESFIELLKSDATPAGKQFLCRKLSVIGTKESVPTLAAMLTQEATSPIEPADMARYALERIPGPEASKALRDALPKTSGTVKVGIINSLGARGDRKAVKPLSKLISDSDKEVAEAALSALGKIGGKQAAKTLGKAKSTVAPELRPVWADAYLMCADELLARNKTKSALAIYKKLYVPQEPATIRIGALRGMVKAEPKKAVETVVEVLRSGDEPLQTAAIGLMPDIPGQAIVKAVTAELGNLSVIGQVQVLSALGTRGDQSALPAVLEAAKSNDADVRIAAYGALAEVGDVATVRLLAETAARTEGAEQQAARESLYRLSGPEIDKTILAGIPRVDTKVRIELIRSLGARNTTAGVGVLLKALRDEDRRVRLEAWKVLKVVADESHLQVLIGLMMHVESEAERAEAENTIAAVARKIKDEQHQADKILAILPSIRPVKSRCSLLRVLGKIGGSGALAMLQEALDDTNAEVRLAAIRVLSDWPTPEPIEDLRKVAKSSDDERERVLALRGFIRLIGIDAERPTEERVGMYEEAMQLPSGISEKKAVLSGLANMKSFAALQMAAAHLEDSALQQEAEAAVVRIAESTQASHPQQTKAILQSFLQSSKNDSLRKRAQELIEQIEKKETLLQEQSRPPDSATKLISGDFSAWRENTGAWQIVGDAGMNPDNEKKLSTAAGEGVIVNGPDGRTVDLFSRMEFGDVRAHIEFMVPSGSNSGVYFMGRYEIQILDSWGKERPTFSDCGGIYQRWDSSRSPKGYEGRPPRVNASRPPGEWQTFNVIFRAPRIDDNGKKTANARFEKVTHNGIVVHENAEVTGPTRAAAYDDEKPAGPLMLQGDHGPVAYRNIWIVPLTEQDQ
jgi:HEAT repeat protein